MTFSAICVIIYVEGKYGRLAERPIALAWKAGIQKCITGSNPVPSATFTQRLTMMALAQNRFGFVGELHEQTRAAHLSSDNVLKLIRKYKKEKDEPKRDTLRDSIVATHVKFVLGQATKASRISQVPTNDLFQNGIMGLLVALDKFNPNRKIKFSTYATPWVKKYIQLGMTDAMDIKIIPQLRTNCRRYLDIKSQEIGTDEIRSKVRRDRLGAVSSLETASRLFPVG